MKLFFTFSVTAFLLLGDLLAGNIPLFPALSVYGAAYFALAYGLNYGIFAAAAAGVALDAVYCRPYCLSAAGFVLTVFAVVQFIKRGRRQFLFLPLAGGFAGLLSGAAGSIIAAFYRSELPGPDLWTVLVFSIGFGGLFFTFIVTFLDFLASRADLPRCIRKNTDGLRGKRRTVSKSQLAGNRRQKR